MHRLSNFSPFVKLDAFALPTYLARLIFQDPHEILCIMLLSKTLLVRKMLQDFFAIKVVLIALMLTVVIGIISFLGLGIFPTVGWVKVTEAQSLPPYDPSNGVFYACPDVGVHVPPFGFPFKYFIWTNMEEFYPLYSISFSVWRIGSCGVPSFMNPLAFLGNFSFFLIGTYLYRRWKAKKTNST